MKINGNLYLDHQSTTPVDARVFAEMSPYFAQIPGNPHSADHHFGWQAECAVENARGRVAQLIGTDAKEIVFTSGATEANNLALLGVARHHRGGQRRRVLVSAIEHKCVLAIGDVLQKQLDYRVDYIPVDGDGRVNIGALEDILGEDVLIVSVMAVNNEVGTIQDIEKISEVVRNKGALLHCDAAQAPCAMDLSLMGDCVDLASLSAHKMYGPQGIGALYVRRELQSHVEPAIYGGAQQYGLRAGTVPVALCVGMGAAANLLDSVNAEQERDALSALRDDFVKRLMELRWSIKTNGPKNMHRHPGNANIQFCGFLAHEILNTLQPRLAASTGSACTSGLVEPSHVLDALGLSRDESESSIRFSIGRDTRHENIEEAVTLIAQALADLEKSGIMKRA